MDKPFAILEEWVRQGRIHLSQPAIAENEPRDFVIEPLPDGLSDEKLFELEMKDVKSLGWSAVPLHNRPPVEIQPQDEDFRPGARSDSKIAALGVRDKVAAPSPAEPVLEHARQGESGDGEEPQRHANGRVVHDQPEGHGC